MKLPDRQRTLLVPFLIAETKAAREKHGVFPFTVQVQFVMRGRVRVGGVMSAGSRG